MSYVSGRSPQFKTHKQSNHLKSALGAYISNRPGATSPELWAYELKDTKYVLMWHIKAGTKIENLPWSKSIYHPQPTPHIECKCRHCRDNHQD